MATEPHSGCLKDGFQIGDKYKSQYSCTDQLVIVVPCNLKIRFIVFPNQVAGGFHRLYIKIVIVTTITDV